MNENEVPIFDVKRLDQLMATRGWGPGELAERTGLSYNAIYKLRSGAGQRPAAETIARLAVALGTTTDFLLGLTDYMHPASDMPLTPGSVEIVEILNRLPPIVAADLLLVVRSFARCYALGRTDVANLFPAPMPGITNEQAHANVSESPEGLKLEPLEELRQKQVKDSGQPGAADGA